MSNPSNNQGERSNSQHRRREEEIPAATRQNAHPVRNMPPPPPPTSTRQTASNATPDDWSNVPLHPLFFTLNAPIPPANNPANSSGTLQAPTTAPEPFFYPTMNALEAFDTMSNWLERLEAAEARDAEAAAARAGEAAAARAREITAARTREADDARVVQIHRRSLGKIVLRILHNQPEWPRDRQELLAAVGSDMPAMLFRRLGVPFALWGRVTQRVQAWQRE